ncbi:NAD-dependent epimerase/dehydratase family protein [Amycolatopsis decaplanina]|uniref:NAD-dependent epimerase/dehydratase n=1 Tax=Amycolatopsis decaplanina DSM 44594 TaxID=1284240 RepID=M2YME5_9PSEU|nr:SDR family oxidoreductase [Amycolatopsis decaplanina]EME55877.1 NAD-dependent epimerase/dehydratase [Amycolatopsis decaplanina DSM 44594]
MKKYLITGGRGYIGSVLTRRLSRSGAQVVVLDNGLVGGPELESPGVTYVDGDVLDAASWEKALDGVDAVVHLAAIVGDPACGVDTDTAWEVNYLGTIRVAEACRRAGVRSLVFASTCSNYGFTADAEVDVWSPMAPQSVYAESKVLSEHYLLSLPREELSTRLLRFATIHGLSPRMRFDLAVNVMTANAVERGGVTVYGGTQWRPFLHVEDAATAVHLVLQDGRRTAPSVYNCGFGEENYRMDSIGELIAEEISGVRMEILEEHTDPRNYRVNFDPIRRELGFTPSRRVIDTVREIRDAMREGKYLDFASPRYSNYLTAVAQRVDPVSA